MDWLRQKFELSRAGGHNVRPMEGLRGFAVFLVFIVHFVTLVKPWISGNPSFLAFANSLHTIGNTGVDLFFVLSGYLIYGSLISRRQQFLRFMSRRVERIYPTFIAVFLAYVLLSFAFPAENKIPSPPAEGMIYVIQNFLLLPGLFPIEPMITVAWSLSYEMFYYLAIPLVIALFRLRDRNTIWRTTFFLGVACSTVIYCAINGGHVRLIMFIAGIVLYEAMSSPRVPKPSSLLGLIALVVGLLCTLIPLVESFKACILFAAFFTLCLACFHSPLAWLPRSFAWTPLRWLGNMSYSYYLLHGLALKASFLALSIVLPVSSYGSWFFWVLLPPMFVLTLIPTVALFLFVERPFSLAPSRTKSSTSGLFLEDAPNNTVKTDAPQAARRLP